EDGGAAYEEYLYEGYAPGGVAVMVEVLSDNKNRAAADVKNIFTKNGGNLGTTGSVSRMFQRKGTIELDAEKVSEDEVMEIALDAGADDIVNEDGIITVTTSPDAFAGVADALAEKGIETLSADVGMVPDAYTPVDKDTAAKVQRLIDRLEDNDDVQNVYHTAEYPDDFEPEE
ncbi:MAG: YebC/PmpR family DNA-binding transcriptional regulator, partial [Treponema sp.]|nr:YebC/PmpR family DNA-binding transcriptional regulator [Treponema sp.]